MNVLVINADCVFVNTSANLCHLAYLKGLEEAGHQIDLLCASSEDRRVDSNMTLPKNVQCKTYPGISLYERMSIRYGRNPANNVAPISDRSSTENKITFRQKFVRFAKRSVLSLYGVHGIYSTFVRKASCFRESKEYDYIISISTPTASHLLAYRLIESQHVTAKHWIQIWEDPWYSDVYGFNRQERVRREEKRLLSLAEKVCYVSPLTLQNQQKLFPESAEKMFWMPLPAYYKNATPVYKSYGTNIYGYFGDYAPPARDLNPFYQAAKNVGIEVNICGNPYGLYPATDYVHIYPRLHLEELKPIEDNTSVLVFLCNRKGGQIPGKLYQYSATDKTILFILDGTEDEQAVLKDYFGKFNRYIFCRNTVEDITRAIRQIESGDIGSVRNVPLYDFEPAKIITSILEAGR